MATGLEAEGPGEQEADEGRTDHDQREPQQPVVGQDLALIEGQDRLAHVRRGRPARGAKNQRIIDQEADEHQDRRRRHVDQEVVEPEAGRRADQDVRRVADERRRPADVRWPGSAR